jgi:hypothetical protein
LGKSGTDADVGVMPWQQDLNHVHHLGITHAAAIALRPGGWDRTRVLSKLLTSTNPLVQRGGGACAIDDKQVAQERRHIAACSNRQQASGQQWPVNPINGAQWQRHSALMAGIYTDEIE